MIKLLYISSFVPYKQIRHAGGQTFNYYVKNISKDKGIPVSYTHLNIVR